MTIEQLLELQHEIKGEPITIREASALGNSLHEVCVQCGHIEVTAPTVQEALYQFMCDMNMRLGEDFIN